MVQIIRTMVSLAFGLFSALMMLNFIMSSIKDGRKQIGILRALGMSNGNIVSIHIMQALLLSVISFVLAIIPIFPFASYLAGVDYYIFTNINTLIIGAVELVSMFSLSMGIALVGSILPIIKNSKQKPIDLISKI